MFKTALEVLRDNITEMLAHVDYELAPYNEAKAKKHDQEHAPLEAQLASFDDALELIRDARNEYVAASEIEADKLLLNWSEAK